MGACLSCLGLRKDQDLINVPLAQQPESQRLISEDPYGQYPNYGTQGHGSANQQYGVSGHLVNLEDAKREQEALASITRWTSK
ncbi:MAG: hypothetical protein Q9227_001986 [Pyrenula ochraceoflavens]